MKKLIFSLSALAALFLAGSCQRENLEPVQQGGTVTYTVQVPASLQTKALGEGYVLNYEVYRAAELGTASAKPVYESVEPIAFNNAGVASFDLEFVKNQKFVVLFWAQTSELQNAENPMFNITDLRNVQLVNCGAANNPNAAVFAGKDVVENCVSTEGGAVELVRPISQLNIYTTKESLQFGTGITLDKSYVKVSGLYKTYNVAEGAAVLTTTTETYEYALNDVPETASTDQYAYVAMNYVGFADEANTVVDVEFSIKTSEANLITHSVGNVPVKPNYRTNIVGNLLTGTTDYNVTIEETWTTPEVVYSVWDGESISEPTLDATAAQPTYVIDEASDLAWFAAAVNGTLPQTRSGSSIDDFKDKTFKLTSDIDLAGHEWTPISMSTDLAGGKTFRGTFDGNGHTIYGLTVNQQEVAGLFGYVYACTIKNVIVDGASINSNHYAGGIVGWVLNNKGNIQVPFVIENCHVKNSTITSTPVQVNGQWDNGDKVGGLVGYAHFEDPDKAANEGAKISGCSVENTTVKAYRDFAGLVGFASCVTIENTTTRNVTLEQDLTHDYKAPNTPTTFGEFIGRDNGGNTIDGHTYVADGVLKDGEQNYYLYNAAALKWFANEVNKYSNYEYPFKDQTLKLMNDVNLGGIEWTPIGDYRFSANRFCGTFDGQGHTISNFQITKNTDKNDSKKSSYGFFGNLEGNVLNLTIADATVNAYAYTGALAGRFNSGLIENCHIVDCQVSNTYWQGGILTGQVNGAGNIIRNCTVKNSSITSKSAVGAISGPVTVDVEGEVLFENCSVINCQVNQQGSFGGNYDKYFGSMFGYLEVCENACIKVNNCTVSNSTVKGQSDAPISGDFDGTIYVNGALAVTNAAALTAAVEAGQNVALVCDITMTESIAIHNANFLLDGNGYTITMAEDATNTYALFDITGGKAAFKNVTFDGIKSGAVVRTVGVEFNAENVTAQNGQHTQQQGLFRLVGKSTIKNCTFKNNTCSMVITLNYDGANNDPQVVENCVFEGNTCNGTAALYYVKGASATINANRFVGNTVNCNSNGATIYMGFTENNVVTNNLFQNNTVNEASTSSRVAGGVFFGYETEFTGNAFVGNKVTGTDAKGNDVCVSTYYTSIDLSGNYWGGDVPVEDTNYFVQHKSDERVVIVNDYLTENPIK